MTETIDQAMTRMVWRVAEAIEEGADWGDEAVVRPICEAYDDHAGDPGDIVRALLDHFHDEGYEIVGSILKRFAVASEDT